MTQNATMVPGTIVAFFTVPAHLDVEYGGAVDGVEVPHDDDVLVHSH